MLETLNWTLALDILYNSFENCVGLDQPAFSVCDTLY